MQQPLPHTKPPKKPLPFPAWVEKTYPKKTPIRSFLQIIGALDMAYMIYRMKIQKQPFPAAEPKRHIIPPMPLNVEDHKKIDEHSAPELSIEFEHKPEPLSTHKASVIEQAIIEPEPLQLQDEPVQEKTPLAPLGGKGMEVRGRLDNEDLDLLKTKQALTIDGNTVSLEPIYGSDDEETAVVINNVSWRAFLPSPELNLSKMLQIARISNEELYVLGRMALGAMSGEGYITADDLMHVVRSLANAKEKTCEVDVRYYDKDSGSKNRTAHTMSIRFQRV